MQKSLKYRFLLSSQKTLKTETKYLYKDGIVKLWFWQAETQKLKVEKFGNTKFRQKEITKHINNKLTNQRIQILEFPTRK